MNCRQAMKMVHKTPEEFNGMTNAEHVALYRHVNGCKKCMDKCKAMGEQLRREDPEYAAQCIMEGIHNGLRVREAMKTDPELRQ